MKRILSNKIFMASFVADLLSNFGDILYYLALMSYVATLPQATVGIALIGASETLPMLFMFFMGMWADKNHHKVESILGTLLLRFGLYLIMAFIMGFSPSLGVVIVASFINVISDLSGTFENALYLPLSLRIINKDDREQAMAFKQTVSFTLQILFQSSGAVLITIMTYRQLALINATTFLISFLMILILRPAINRLLKENPIKVTAQSVEGSVIKQTWQSLTDIVKVIVRLKELRFAMVIVPALNAIFSVLSILVVLLMSQRNTMTIGSTATTLAILSIVTLAGNVLGSFTTMLGFIRFSLEQMLVMASFISPLIFIGMYLENSYLMLFAMFCLTIISGAINPKLSTLMMNVLPEDRLATIGSGIDTYFTLGMFAAKFITSGLILVLSAKQLIFFFLLASFAVMLYALWSIISSKRVILS